MHLESFKSLQLQSNYFHKRLWQNSWLAPKTKLYIKNSELSYIFYQEVG